VIPPKFCIYTSHHLPLVHYTHFTWLESRFYSKNWPIDLFSVRFWWLCLSSLLFNFRNDFGIAKIYFPFQPFDLWVFNWRYRIQCSPSLYFLPFIQHSDFTFAETSLRLRTHSIWFVYSIYWVFHQPAQRIILLSFVFVEHRVLSLSFGWHFIEGLLWSRPHFRRSNFW
jgi:hypothetical protein